jgi:dipeptidyl aminopeptidase/acylaminoacyl peptidase
LRISVRRGASVVVRAVLIAIVATGFVHPEVKQADYERAAGLAAKYRELLVDVAENPVWVAGEDTLVYSRNSNGKHEFVQVDAASGQKSSAFDHARLAEALSKAAGREFKATDLPLMRLQFTEKKTAIEFTLDQARWRCELNAYHCAPVTGGPGARGTRGGGATADGEMPWAANSLTNQRTSPDGKWEALVENYNIVLRAKGAKNTEKTILSTDGSEENYYNINSITWSPDSTHLVAYRVRPGYKRLVHYVESSPATQLQPMYTSIVYPKAGDVLDLQQPVLFDVASKHEFPVSSELFPNPFSLGRVQWWKDSHGFTFDYNQRGHQVYRVIEVDGRTGTASTLIDEESRAFIDYRPLVNNQTDTGKIYRHDVADGKEIIWMSERDGWAHLYLVEGATGRFKNTVTKGDWPVRSVDYVDDAKRQIYFEASGVKAGEDPYFEHAYRINFDGSGLTPLTEGEGNHHLEYSSDGKYYVDLHSTVSEAPTLDLYEVEGNKKIATLEQGNIDKLKAGGWAPPEPFVAKGRDGKTEIWGVIWKPANFDPAKKYPVIEDIYAGPQGSFVPKTFSPRAEPLTELGFVVVQIDGMGTNNRSKAFHDVAWKNLKDAGFPDRILWHKAAAAKYPWYDISNVGVFGTSAGGQNAMGALLFHPEFYKVAVSNSGCHDNRMDKIWWNEQWMGWPVGPQYSESSNVDNAYKLQGKLMLVVGELDDNVDPSSTFQVADRLEKANKYFDLLYVPGGHHGAGGAYGYRKLEDFFVHNLLGQEPPAWNQEPAKAVAP